MTEENIQQQAQVESNQSANNGGDNSVDIKALQTQLQTIGDAITKLQQSNNNTEVDKNKVNNLDVRSKIKEEESKEAEKEQLIKNVEFEFRRNNELRELAKKSGESYTKIIDEYEKFSEKGYLKSEINNLSAKGLLDELLSDPNNKEFIPQSKRNKVAEYQALNERQQIAQAHTILTDILPLVHESKERDNVEKKRSGVLPANGRVDNIDSQFIKRNTAFKGKLAPYPTN